MSTLDRALASEARAVWPAGTTPGGLPWERLAELASLARLPDRLPAASDAPPHVPFLHWTVLTARPGTIVWLGMHRAVHYAALCDAAALATPPPRCFAVAPLVEADEDGAAERRFLRRHAQSYRPFSVLLRGRPAEVMPAVGRNIDLLVIDPATLGAETADLFAAWSAAVSRRALVIVDGIRSNGSAAVSRFWQALAERHPHFEMDGGDGLGLATLGGDAPPALQDLCVAAPGELERFRAAFAGLDELWMTVQTSMLKERNQRHLLARREAEWAQTLAEAHREAVAARETVASEFDERVRLVRESSLFDAGWYLAVNRDVAAAGLDPATHYVEFGGAKGRSPSRDFDGRWYLEHNPDVAAAAIPGLVHYLETGAAEGRPCRRLGGAAAAVTKPAQPQRPPHGAITTEAAAAIARDVDAALASGGTRAAHLGLHLPRLTVFDIALGVAAGGAAIEDLNRLLTTADAALARASRYGGGTLFLSDGEAAGRLEPPDRVTFRCIAVSEPADFAACHNVMMAEAFAGGAEIYVVAAPAIALHPDCVLGLARMVRAAQPAAIVAAVDARTIGGSTYDPVTFAVDAVPADCFAVPRTIFVTIGGFMAGRHAAAAVADYARRAAAAGFARKLCPLATIISGPADGHGGG